MANEDEIREKEIISFLKKNKNFFIKNSELVNELNFPNLDNSSDKVIDLEAYRYKKISQQNIDLQNQMTKVLLAGKSHLNAQKRILKSTIRILNIKSLPKLIGLIKNDLKIILGCDEMNCFITNENVSVENLSQLDTKIANSYFKTKMATNLNQNPKGLLLFFPNKSAMVKSYILLKIKFHEDSIILAMGSKDKNKFTIDMQTDLVEYLIKIIEINLLNIK
ncbi:DUF484 family protein [Pelagibacteraceae bacterium]|jgi:uncharacterized protein YigA (DUF484 family)|nr:DUF484 family protein [Pelagibacteraceae bacterium]